MPGHTPSFKTSLADTKQTFKLGLGCDDQNHERGIVYYDSQVIPRQAAKMLLHSLADYMNYVPGLETTARASNPGASWNRSILNHPPQMDPKWPQSQSESKEHASLQSGFIRMAEQYHDRDALDFLYSTAKDTTPAKHRIFSYGDLHTISDHLSRRLSGELSRDVHTSSKSCFVPVYMSTCPELYISYLGLLKAGLAFCPLPIDGPSARLADILEDIRAPIVLGCGTEPVEGAWAETTATSKPRWIDVSPYLDTEAEEKTGRPKSSGPLEEHYEPPQQGPASRDDIAYILYTSGSTGKPKGVPISHHAASCSITSHLQVIPISGGSHQVPRWFQFAAPTFDPSIMETFVTLSSGSTLCSAPRDITISDPEAAIASLRATIMMSTPSLASLLRPKRLPSLQSIWTMGEALTKKVIKTFSQVSQSRLYDHHRGHEFDLAGLANAYGPTEGAINCTLYPNFERETRGSIIGPPLPTCSLFVMDDKSKVPKPVPLGFSGEIVIGGPQISIGYLNRPEENASAFVGSEFGRLYRTGDKGRVVWDARHRPVLEFLGRLSDDQVKINGRRVELGEIDAAISTVRDVVEVLTTISRDQSRTGDSTTVVACIRVERDATVKRQRLAIEKSCRQAVDSALPSYMHPSKYVFLSHLPRSTAGKLDRREAARIAGRELINERDGDPATQSAKTQKDRPRPTVSGTHETDPLRAALRGLDLIDGQDVHSSTLDLNIDSLQAMRFLQICRDQGVDNLSLTDVVNARSLNDLQDALTRNNDQETVNGDPSTREMHSSEVESVLDEFATRWKQTCFDDLQSHEQDIEAILPTTPTQSRILLSFQQSQVTSQGLHKNYINHTVYELKQNMDLENFKRAWKVVVDRFAIYRTCFVAIDDDVAPFAQCILSSKSPKASLRWRDVHVKNKDVSQQIVEDNGAIAESMIDLHHPPVVITFLRSSNKVFIMLSVLHAIFDYGSLQMLLEDVVDQYQDNPPKQRSSIREAVFYHVSNASSETDQYWSTYLDEISPTSFPHLSPIRAEYLPRKTLSVTVRSSITLSEIQARVRGFGASALAVLQAAWSSILLTYSEAQSTEVTFGTVFANRLDSSSSTCMAPTFTIVPVKVKSLSQASGKPLSNTEVLVSLAELNKAAAKRLNPRLEATAGSKNRRLYDTILALQVFADSDEGEEILKPADAIPMRHDFAVMMEIWPNKDGFLEFKATVNDECLDQEAAKAMLNQFDDVLSWIVSNPSDPFSDASNQVRDTLKSISNPRPSQELGTRADSLLMHTQFESHAEDNPQNTALVFLNDSDSPESNAEWTYRRLDDRASELARFLVGTFDWNVGKIIPILMEKCPELYIAILAIAKAGAAWCPIDPQAPPPRRHELIARTDAKAVLVATGTNGSDPAGFPDGVSVIDVSKFVNDQSVTAVSELIDLSKCRPKPEDIAYLIWTSGTTGLPKGVPISHQAVATSMRALQDAIPGNTEESPVPRCLQFPQQTFDVFVQDLFYTWGLGGTLISASRELMLGSFTQVATASNATHAHLTPAFASGIFRSSCPTLKVVTMIGEKLPQHTADDWGTDMHAFNTYGPAEAAVVSTLIEFSGENRKLKSANVGKPLPSVSCYVLKEGRVLMQNGVGELALGGRQLADGYWKNPQKTNEKFVWNDTVKERLYMTGDIVRLLADGSLEFLGREDDLVKINGIRVELSEISFALKDCHQDVEQIETYYLSRPDRPAKAVVSYIAVNHASLGIRDGALTQTGEKAVEIAQAGLRTAQKSLPEYMVPRVFIVLKEMPKTPSAKVDRKALTSAYESLDLESWESKVNPSQESPSGKPEWNREESQILSLVSSFRNTPMKGMNRSSYLPALGIDSLTSARFSKRLNDAGYKVNVASILRSRTIGDLLSAATSRSQDLETASFNSEAFNRAWRSLIRHDQEHDFFVLPTTSLQDSLLGETANDSNAYWSSHFYKLPDDVDLEALKSAWQTVSDKTEALRTGFINTAEVEGKPTHLYCPTTFLQLVHDRWQINMKTISIAPDSVKSVARQVASNISREQGENTFRKPPWGLTILQGDHGTIMMLTIHHAVHDEQSIGFLIEDVYTTYTSSISDFSYRPQLRDFVAKSLHPTAKSQQQSVEFWSPRLEEFADPEGLSWPDLTGHRETDKHADSEELVSAYMQLSISNEEFADTAQQLSVSPASVIRAAFGHLLTSYLETSKVIFGETLSERVHHRDLEGCVAPMITVLPVPYRASGSAGELLKDQHAFNMSARNHRQIPATSIRKIIRRPQSKSLYPAIFVFYPSDMLPAKNAHAPWEQMEDLVGLSVEHPIAINVYNKDGWSIEVIAQSNLMEKVNLEVFCMQLNELVLGILRSPDQPMASMLNDSSSQAISVSDSALEVPRSHSSALEAAYWVKYHSQHHPDWTAVEVATRIDETDSKTEFWTFEKLHQESNRIAAFISQMGYRKKSIAVCFGRSLESYAVILGIMKSGNIYLPIDDGLPQERKALLLHDSDSVMLFVDWQCESLFESNVEGLSVINLDDPEFGRSLSYEVYEADLQIPDPDASAYLLYTSGSTGKPKGVLISHRNLCNFVEGLSGYIGHCHPATHSKGGVGKFLGLASRAFDVHLCEMFLSWRLGLTAVTAPREVLLDDLRLAVTSLKVTHACFVPSLLDQSGLNPQNAPELVYFSVGGEKLSKQTLDTWAGQDKTLIVNAYGPTELAIGCCASRVTTKANLRNIGRPFGNTRAHVLLPDTFDYAFRGQTGELCITGDLVGNGYLNRPDAAGFIDDFRGQRMYRTGDIVRMMADGSLEYFGRSDDQTKIRGQRIELGEVSESIRESAKQKVDVATLLLKHPDLPRPQLIAFVSHSTERSKRYGMKPSLLEGEKEWTGQIQGECKQLLPTFMVPDFVIPTSVIPLAPISGKADSKLLKAFFEALQLSALLGSVPEPGEKAPMRDFTESEETVCSIIRSLIDTKGAPVSYRTTIFELGFDSLSAIGLSIRLRKHGFNCNVASVLSRPTIENLASLPKRGDIENDFSVRRFQEVLADFERKFKDHDKLKPFQDRMESIRPCLPLQEAMVASSINDASGNRYVNHVALTLSPSLDLYELEQAWLHTIQVTPILRTCFIEAEKAIVQVILSSSTVAREWHGAFWVSHDAPDSWNPQEESTCQELIDQIEVKPPLRLHLVKCRDSQPVLHIFIHHSMYDGHSFRMIWEDIHARCMNQEPMSRTPFDNMLGHFLCRNESAQERFWKSHLSGYNRTLFVGGKESNAGDSLIITRTLRSSLSKLQSLASQHKTTISTVVQCIFAAAAGQVLQSTDITYGLILSGRTVPVEGAETVIAPCITTMPQRVNLSKRTGPLTALFTQMQEIATQCLEYQHTPLRDISRWIGAERPIFDCLVSYLGAGEQRFTSSLWKELESNMPPDYPVAIEFEPDQESGTLLARFVFTPAFGSTEKAEQFLEQIDFMLTAVSSGESLTIENIGIESSVKHSKHAKRHSWDEGVWTPEEEKMKKVVSEFCGTEDSTVTKNVSFFRLGIDSISAIRFARELRASGLQAKSSDVMRFPCIGALWDHLKTRNEPSSERNRPPESQMHTIHNEIPLLSAGDGIAATYSCTPLQTGMITGTLASGGSLYVHHHALELESTLDMERLHEACKALVMTNDILRTTFHFMSKSQHPWIAAVHRDSSIRWNQTLASSVDDAIGQLAKDLVFNDADSFQQPPIRFTLLQASGKSFLIVSMHHALYDGLSVPLILEDIARAYLDREAAVRPSFASAATWVNGVSSDSVSFWSKRLQGYKVVRNTSPQAASSRTVIVDRTTSLDISRALQGCQAIDVTLQSVALLAFGKILSCLLGRRDVVFGHVVSGRSIPIEDPEAIIGPLFNTLPFRVKLDESLKTNQDLVRWIQQLVSEAQEHQHAPLQHVQNAWRWSNRGSSENLLDSLFLFQKIDPNPSAGQGLWDVYSPGGEITNSEYRFNLEVEQHPDCLVLRCACHDNFLSEEELSQVVDDFEAALEDIIFKPSGYVTAFPNNLATLPVSLKEPPPTDNIESFGGPAFELVRQILSEISGTPQDLIESGSSIFSIGLDSIAAIKVASACRENQVQLSVADVLQGVTLGGISKRARTISQAQPSDGQETNVDIDYDNLLNVEVERESVESILPCLSGQVFHLSSWLRSGRTMFEPTWAYTAEKVDIDRLKSAWLELRSRHSVLRTVFALDMNQDAVQIVLKPVEDGNSAFTVEHSDDDMESSVKARIQFQSSHPSDMASPPARLCIVRGKDRDAVLLTLHHSLYDAWSIQMLISDLSRFYRGTTLEPAPSFLAFTKHIIRTIRTIDQESFWQATLKDIEPTLLKPPSPGTSLASPQHLFLSHPSVIRHASTLVDTLRPHSLTLPPLLFLAIARMAARLTHIRNPVLGTYVLGRASGFQDAARMPGPCVNVLPLAVPDALDAPAIDVAKRLRERLSDMVPFEQCGLKDVLRWAGFERSEVFNIYVNLLWGREKGPDDYGRGEGMFERLDVGVPTDFVSKDAVGGKTAVDGLVWPGAGDGLFVDVSLKGEEDRVDFGVRCQGGVVGEEELRGALRRVGQEVEEIVKSLE